ncbi:MAG: PD40 domain-containing protein [Acidobacteria bacterium]|nr:PD40 domain-containing protein [Acidobacteriota bacterium]
MGVTPTRAQLPGQREWPPEWESFADERTGARITRLTGFPCINHPLYYLTNSFTRDGRWMVFASDRAGKMDLFRVSLTDGTIQRLTDLDGLQPFSGNVVDDEVFFTTDGQIHRLNLEEGSDRILAGCPGAGFGEVTVSCDRQWAAALITREGRAGILVTRTDGSASHVLLEGIRALYHPQFHPTDPEQLIYSADPPDPRMWTVRSDGTGDRPIYRNPPDTWFVHETFLGKTRNIIFSHWHHGLCRVGLNDGVVNTIAKFSAWHVRSSPDGHSIICDTHLPDIGLCLVNPESGEHRVLCNPGASNQGFQWREPLPLGASTSAPGWQTMVETATGETAYGPQWSHPHPSFSPDGRLVSYTSDATGWPQAYVVEP